MISELLLKLGLTKNESLVYEILLVHSPANASYLAKKCGLSRSSVYTSLNLLIAKGLVATSYKNEVKQFIAKDFDAMGRLLDQEKMELEEKKDLYEKSFEEIEKLRVDWLKVPQIINFEGQEGLKGTYLNMMREAKPGSTMYVIRNEFVWDEGWQFIFEPEWHERVKKLKATKKLETKLIVNDSKEEQNKTGYYKSKKGLSVKLLPKDQALENFALYINEDALAILSFEKGNMVGVKIINKSLTENFKRIFESLWEKSKDLE